MLQQSAQLVSSSRSAQTSITYSKVLVAKKNRIERALVKALVETMRSISVLQILVARLALNYWPI